MKDPSGRKVPGMLTLAASELPPYARVSLNIKLKVDDVG